MNSSKSNTKITVATRILFEASTLRRISQSYSLIGLLYVNFSTNSCEMPGISLSGCHLMSHGSQVDLLRMCNERAGSFQRFLGAAEGSATETYVAEVSTSTEL